MSSTHISASDIEARAARWLAARDRDDWSGADQSALDAWLDADIHNSVAYWRLEAAWNNTERLTALRRARDPGSETPQPARRLRPLLFAAAAAAAAVVVGVVALGFGSTYLFQPAIRSYATAIGERETIRFADGSQIELNTDTSLRADVSASHRRIWLDKGEAFFQVQHNAQRPFVVVIGDHTITDLGTKFRVRREPNHLEVALLEGRAELSGSDAAQLQKPVVLLPGDVAVATAKAIKLTKAAPKTLSNGLAWRHGMVVFNNTTLVDAASEFNRYNREKIVIADPVVAKNAIYGTFEAENVAAFARLAHEVLGLRVEHRGNEIVISR